MYKYLIGIKNLDMVLCEFKDSEEVEFKELNWDENSEFWSVEPVEAFYATFFRLLGQGFPKQFPKHSGKKYKIYEHDIIVRCMLTKALIQAFVSFSF